MDKFKIGDKVTFFRRIAPGLPKHRHNGTVYSVWANNSYEIEVGMGSFLRYIVKGTNLKGVNNG